MCCLRYLCLLGHSGVVLLFCFSTYSVLEIRLSSLLARKLQNWNIYIDSIEKNWQKSLVRINFYWPWATGPLLKSLTGIVYPMLPVSMDCSCVIASSVCSNVYIF